MQEEYSLPISQGPDTQVLGGSFLGSGSDIYSKDAKPMKRVITGIYAITNPLGQTYIGQSVNIDKRWKDYQYGKKIKGQPKIYRSLKRFGVGGHVFTLLAECDTDFLHDLEADYKQRFVNENGWENALFCFIDDSNLPVPPGTPIIQYSLDGEQIKTYVSIQEASRQTGTDPASINHASKGKRHYKTAGGFQWRAEGQPAPNKIETKHTGGVQRFTMNDELIAEYPSIKTAADATGAEPTHITKCCKGLRKSHLKSKWKYINN